LGPRNSLGTGTWYSECEPHGVEHFPGVLVPLGEVSCAGPINNALKLAAQKNRSDERLLAGH